MRQVSTTMKNRKTQQVLGERVKLGSLPDRAMFVYNSGNYERIGVATFKSGVEARNIKEGRIYLFTDSTTVEEIKPLTARKGK